MCYEFAIYASHFSWLKFLCILTLSSERIVLYKLTIRKISVSVNIFCNYVRFINISNILSFLFSL